MTEPKPHCIDGTRAHRFPLPTPDGRESWPSTCSRGCGLTWTFRAAAEDNIGYNTTNPLMYFMEKALVAS